MITLKDIDKNLLITKEYRLATRVSGIMIKALDKEANLLGWAKSKLLREIILQHFSRLPIDKELDTRSKRIFSSAKMHSLLVELANALTTLRTWENIPRYIDIIGSSSSPVITRNDIEHDFRRYLVKFESLFEKKFLKHLKIYIEDLKLRIKELESEDDA